MKNPSYITLLVPDLLTRESVTRAFNKVDNHQPFQKLSTIEVDHKTTYYLDIMQGNKSVFNYDVMDRLEAIQSTYIIPFGPALVKDGFVSEQLVLFHAVHSWVPNLAPPREADPHMLNRAKEIFASYKDSYFNNLFDVSTVPYMFDNYDMPYRDFASYSFMDIAHSLQIPALPILFTLPEAGSEYGLDHEIEERARKIRYLTDKASKAMFNFLFDLFKNGDF